MRQMYRGDQFGGVAIATAPLQNVLRRSRVASLRAQEQVHLAAWIARRGRPSKRQTIETIQRQAERLFVQ